MRVATYDFGGDGPDLLLAHATGFHAHVWLPIVERLRARFRCVAFDARGHGDTGHPPDDDFDWHAAAADVLPVVDDLGLDRPYGVGHSAGATHLLLAKADRPGTFRALYCWEPVIALRPIPPWDGPLSEGARRRKEVFADREEAYERFAARPPLSTLAPDALRAYVDHGFDDLPDGTVRLKCRGEDEAATYRHGFSHHAFSRLPEVACPVVVECGEHSDAFRIDLCAQYAEQLPRGRATELPGLGHFGPLEDPATVAARIVDALLASP